MLKTQPRMPMLRMVGVSHEAVDRAERSEQGE
jgi:hypothetical protein